LPKVFRAQEMEVSSPEVGANVGDLFSNALELRTRQHKMLNIRSLRPSKHYFPLDKMDFERRL
jgi:hypothetical protein